MTGVQTCALPISANEVEFLMALKGVYQGVLIDEDIKLSDLSGELVAERVFSPRDYLKRNESRLKLLRPDIPTVITLKVLDPGSEAVNFEFRFL